MLQTQQEKGNSRGVKNEASAQTNCVSRPPPLFTLGSSFGDAKLISVLVLMQPSLCENTTTKGKKPIKVKHWYIEIKC